MFGLTRWIRGWEEGERRERNKRKRQPCVSVLKMATWPLFSSAIFNHFSFKDISHTNRNIRCKIILTSKPNNKKIAKNCLNSSSSPPDSKLTSLKCISHKLEHLYLGWKGQGSQAAAFCTLKLNEKALSLLDLLNSHCLSAQVCVCCYATSQVLFETRKGPFQCAHVESDSRKRLSSLLFASCWRTVLQRPAKPRPSLLSQRRSSMRSSQKSSRRRSRWGRNSMCRRWKTAWTLVFQRL